MTVAALSRRRFLIGTAAAAGGFSLGFHLPFTAQAQERKAILPEVNAWVLIHPDDTVVIRIARSEMGQGTLTGLAQLVAEELDCDWSKVTTEYPTPGESLRRNRIWGNFSTGGSRGIRESHEYVRQGGAAAREMLIAAAATLWKVPEAECSAASSIITHNPSGRSVTYGAVASLAAHMQPPADVRLKDPKVWKIAGKPLPRLDTRDKLTGKQVYGVDLQLPGMLNASIRACPVFGGKVASFDAAAVSGMPGVRKVVQVDETAVAVVADTWWQAHSALLALPIVWDEGPNENVTSQSIAEMLKEGLEAEDAVIGTRIGDVRTELAGDVKLVSATYSYPYQHHATMEPMNATALYTTDRCEAWVPTQNGEASLSLVAEVSGLPIQQCDVHKLHLGGGFGRRGWHQEYLRQAVILAKAFPGSPVKLIWSREEDMLHGAYHPVTQCRLRAALNKNGEVTAFHMRISGQSILWPLRAEVRETGRDPAVFQGLNDGGSEGAFGYKIPNLLIDHAMRNPPCSSGVLARGQSQPERSLRRVLRG